MQRIVPTTRKLMLIALLAALVPAVSACNTVKGAGKDVEKAGEGIQNGAENVQDDMTN